MLTSTARRSATLVLSMEDRLARCATPMTRFTLFNAMTNRNATISINGIPVTLSSVQREDGSGNSFNLIVYAKDGKAYRCYCRTTD
jgi:hypothetical protein